jgi:predicted secreted protein with PEFG-CTERM motif
MNYKAYALITILMASLALAAPIGSTYATTDTATTNATTGGAATNATTGGAATNATTGGAATNATTGGEWRTFDLTVDNQTQPIQYMITGGSVENMTLNIENTTLSVSINSTDDGTLVIRLPRNVIDAKTDNGSDTQFAAYIDDSEYTEPGENETTADMRTLSIGFTSGSQTIDVIGTIAIPEFSTIAVVVLAVAIVGIILATARYSKFNFSPRL